MIIATLSKSCAPLIKEFTIFISDMPATIAIRSAPLKLQQIWAIRIRLEIANDFRDLAVFNLAIDSKLRGCDLITLKVKDIAHGRTIQSRAIIVQKKTGLPVQFELTEKTRKSTDALISSYQLSQSDYLFKSRIHSSAHFSTRQYGRIVDVWVSMIGLDQPQYGTHTMRRTKPALIYKKTKNLRACQLLLGHRKLESTVRYLGIEVDDALEVSFHHWV